MTTMTAATTGAVARRKLSSTDTRMATVTAYVGGVKKGEKTIPSITKHRMGGKLAAAMKTGWDPRTRFSAGIAMAIERALRRGTRTVAAVAATLPTMIGRVWWADGEGAVDTVAAAAY